MEEPTKTWLNSIHNAICSLQREYSINKGMLLTEGDLECHLFSKLLAQNSLKGFHKSKDEEINTTYVHSQVTWFKPDKKSGYEVDITIGDPQYLNVNNLELFEAYTNKGFAYDGPCVAIEIKFIRGIKNVTRVIEDCEKFRDKIIPSKLKNIKNLKYKNSNEKNIAFVSVVGCKSKEIFMKAIPKLRELLSNKTTPCPENLFVYVFYQDEISLINGSWVS